MKRDKLKILFLAVFIVMTFFGFVACADSYDYSNYVKITFNLEGGVYQNCSLPFAHYYKFEEGTVNLIKEPADFGGEDVGFIRSGYTFEGWYRTKTVDDNGDAVYSDKWDFASDKVGDEGITLYAAWKKIAKYVYNVCYIENEETFTLGSYNVNGGDHFSDILSYAKKRVGYTPLRFTDNDGNEWQNDFAHPGGESGTQINVYVEYIKGTYSLVGNVAELKAAKNKNIYLTADIDFEGERFSFGDYTGTLLGNNYTISNFELICGSAKDGGMAKADILKDIDEPGMNSWYVSLFNSLNGATVKDVSFADISIVLKADLIVSKIYLTPLCVQMSNTTISNVSFSADYYVAALPNGFDAEYGLIVVGNAPTYKADAESITEDFTAILNRLDN